MEPSKISRGSGPEPTKYDRMRHESMKLRDIPYGFFSVVKDPLPPLLCTFCNKEIVGEDVVIDGQHFHNPCFSEYRRATS